MKQIANAILAIMEECKTIDKDGTNDYQHYDYVSEANAVAKIRRLLVKHGVIIVPSAIENLGVLLVKGKEGNEKALVTAVFKYDWIHAASGEVVTISILGQGVDSGDKAAYKAITGANKYNLMKTLQLATGDDPEGDASTDKDAYDHMPPDVPPHTDDDAPDGPPPDSDGGVTWEGTHGYDKLGYCWACPKDAEHRHIKKGDRIVKFRKEVKGKMEEVLAHKHCYHKMIGA
jgi:hypothetical protein